MNVLASDFGAVGEQQLIGVCEDGSKRAARVVPFVDDLLEDARVRMLRDEAGSEQFDALASDFFDDRRIVEEPPAAERHQLIEFAGVDGEFVLIFAAEDAH